MRPFISSSLLLLFLLLQSACQESEPIRIGFLGGLTTRAAGLSSSGRDGFQLAVEESNARGGINGRKVEGIIQDTHMHKETALQAVKTLINQDVKVIVGPMTSQTAIAVVPEANAARIPMISPTVSTNQLNDLDDYFFRVYYTNAQAAQLLANRTYSKEKINRIAAIYDLENRAYTEDWVNYYEDSLKDNGSAQVVKIPFDVRSDTLFLDLAKQVSESDVQGVLILANAVDTAMICQQLAIIGANLPRYATGWSYSDALLEFGGKSVEGLTLIQSANFSDPSPEVQKFIKSYRDRFHSAPNFPALHAYDATRIALSLLEKTTDPQELKVALLKMEAFAGVHGELSFNRYGELKKPRLYLARIVKGQFVNID